MASGSGPVGVEIISTGAMRMLPLIVVFCGGSEESCAWMVTGVPVVLTIVGVPLKTPAELIPIPCGSEPDTKPQVVLPRPPAELRLSE